MSFTIANSLDEALAALAAGARPVAGGSDLVVGARHGKAPLPAAIVAIDRLAELAAITATDRGISVGALVNHASLMIDPTIVANFTCLADASALVGSPATRNVGTLGGNVMNGSPAMDTGAPLMVLNASVELVSQTARRRIPVADLWTGPGQTVAATAELCCAIYLPDLPAQSGSAYVRLEYRRAMEIAVVGAAAAVSLDGEGNIASVSVALTAVAATIIAVTGTESVVGLGVDAAAERIATLASAQATPISDLRAGAAYRRHCVGVMARRALVAAGRRAAGESISVPVNRSGAST